MKFKKVCQTIGITVGLLIIFTILFAVWQPFIWQWKFGQPAPALPITAETLGTLMALVIALLSLGVGIFGISTYMIVSHRIESLAEKKVMEEAKRIITWLANNLSYSFWNLASPKDMDELKNQFIAQAIQLAKQVHDEITPKLDQEDPDNQIIIGAVRNNLASYFAHLRQERELAKGYAKYIKNISAKFPQTAEAWQQTYKEVSGAFPDQ